MKKILIIIIATLGFANLTYGATILFPQGGGTGLGSATAGQIGDCLKVSNNSPFTYELGTCGGGGGSIDGTGFAGMMASWVDSNTLRATSTILGGQFIATSTTATSTFAGPVGITGYHYVGPYIYDGLYPNFDGGFFQDYYIADFTKDSDNFASVSLNNFNAGANASIDLVFNNNLTADPDGDGEFNYYADIGYNSSNYNVPAFGLQNVPNMFYMYNKDGPVNITTATSSTAGYIQFVTGGFSSEAARFTTTGALGIGSTSPSARFAVTNPTSENTVVFEDQASDTTPFTIGPTGNVGIGNWFPSVKLHVSDGNILNSALVTSDPIVLSYQNTAPGFSIISSSASSGHRAVFKGVRSGGTIATPLVPNADDDVLTLLGAIYDGVDTEATAGVFFKVDGAVSSNVAPQRISFVTSETSGSVRQERFTVKSNGNVGVGTTSPYRRFSVSDGAVFGSDVLSSYFTATSTTAASTFPYASTTVLSSGTICLTGDVCRTTWPATGGTIDGNGIAGMMTSWVDADTLRATSTIIGNNFIATSSTATSTFAGDVQVTGTSHLYVHGLQANDSQGIHLHSNNGTEIGYLGAGGGANITWNGNTNSSGTFTSTSVSPNTFPYASTTQITSSNNAYLAVSGGSVAIGTTSPTNKLTVASTGQTAPNIFGAFRIGQGTGGKFGYMDMVTDPSTGNPYFYIQSIHSGTAFRDLILNPSGANVGVATTSPYAKFSVSNVDSVPSFIVEDSVTPDLSPFIIDNNGYVAMGTTSTQFGRFTVAGLSGEVAGVNLDLTDTAQRGEILIKENSVNQGMFQYRGSTNSTSPATLRVGTFTTIPLLFLAGGIEQMRITSSGTVGIGTSTPLSELQIASTEPELYLTDTNASTNQKHWFLESSAGVLRIATSSDAQVETATAPFTISANGQITTGLSTMNVPPIVVRGGSTGANMIELQRTSGATLTFGWSLAGGCLAFTDSTAGFLVNNICGDDGTNSMYIGGRGRVASDARISVLAGKTYGSTAGTDVSAVEMRLASGAGTGAGTGGFITFFTANPTTSGTTPHTYTEKMRLANNGWLGIGGIPLRNQHIFDTSWASSTLQTSSTVTGAEATLNFKITSNSTADFNYAGIGAIRLANGTANLYLANNTVGNASSSVARLIVAPTGEIGIGTTTPYAKLSVVGPVVAEYFHATSTTATSTFAGHIVQGSNLVSSYLYPSFSYATSTAWTGTTTIALGPAYNGETWRGIKCYTDTGTLNVSINDGTNRMNMFNASTTVGQVTLSINNRFVDSEKRYIDIGTPASTPTKISCTVQKTLDVE